MARPDLAADRARALALTPVSRETKARLDRFVSLILDWQSRMNLIAASTEPVLWTRHIADSLQLLALAPDARIWADLGSGGGFPGMVIACALADREGAQVHLVESTQKKCLFLREAARITQAPAIVHAERVADFARHAPPGLEVVTARALAPLPKLFPEAFPLLKTGAQGLFLKGQDVDAELTDAAKSWHSESRLVPSRTDPHGKIIVVQKLRKRAHVDHN